MKKAIEAAVSMAYAYLLGTEWVEFSTLRHGPSTALDWIGGYIRRCLPDLPGLPAEVFPRFSAKSSTDLDSEANWCLVTGRPLRGWWNHLISRSSAPPWHFALSTYTLEEVSMMYPLSGGQSWNPTSVSWCRDSFEVSALALQCQWETKLHGLERELVQQQFPSLDSSLTDSIDWGVYVQKRVSSIKRWILAWLGYSLQTGLNGSKWWSTDAYGWHHVAELDLDANSEIKRSLIKRIHKVESLTHNRYGELCPFTTALNLMTLMRLEPTHASIPHLVELCLAGQRSNGSWSAPAILRIPELAQPRFQPIDQDRRVCEDKGLLTTATVTQALKCYAAYLARP